MNARKKDNARRGRSKGRGKTGAKKVAAAQGKRKQPRSNTRSQPHSKLPRRRRFDPLELRDIAEVSTKLGVVIVDDCMRVLEHVPNNSVDLVITSPPYERHAKYNNGEKYERKWYEEAFLPVTEEIHRILQPRGSLVLNYRSRRYENERGTMQYELIGWLREQGFLFAEDFVWGKPSPPPGRFKRTLKDAIEYCFQFTKSAEWQFFPEQCLQPAKWDAKDRARRRAYEHNHVREVAPSGHGRNRVRAGPDLVRPSNLLYYEPEFGPNPTSHPARFPIEIPDFFIRLLTKRGDLVVDPFAGTCTAAVAAEHLKRKWIAAEIHRPYVKALPARLNGRTNGTRR
jgi:site-specific DNA-methyltransferase (adenine-specific)